MFMYILLVKSRARHRLAIGCESVTVRKMRDDAKDGHIKTHAACGLHCHCKMHPCGTHPYIPWLGVSGRLIDTSDISAEHLEICIYIHTWFL